MRRPERKCVKCLRLLKAGEILAAEPFPCPGCHTLLQAVESYPQVTGWGAVLLAIAVLFGLGFRGLHLFSATLVSFVPVVFVAVNLLKYLFPPKVIAYLPKDCTLRLRD